MNFATRVLFSCLFAATLLPARAIAADQLYGAGATFPFPLYEKWFATFTRKFPEFPIEYRPIGSGAGVEALAKRQVDFAASDAPLTDAELAAYPLKIHHIPATVGGVVVIYHVEGFANDLRLTPATLAEIYMGHITRWGDPRLKVVNRGVALPDRPIHVVHRADTSGTTWIFTNFLAGISPEWRAAAGAGSAIHWPAGAGADYNDGVSRQVVDTPDSIGYVEFFYALENHLSHALMRNSAGRFIAADLTSLPAAAASLPAGTTGDLRISILNAPGRDAYPIAALTYLLVPTRFEDPRKGRAMTEFLRWMLDSGQKQAGALGYVALPQSMVERAGKLVDEIVRGQPVGTQVTSGR